MSLDIPNIIRAGTYPPFVYMASVLSQASQSLSAATTYLAFSVVPTAPKVFTKFRFYAANLTGTAASISVTVELQADASGAPSNTALDTATMAAGSFSTAGWYEAAFTGNVSLSAGTIFWVVIKPIATHYPSISYSTANVYTANNRVHSVNSGTSWSTGYAQASGVLFGFSDGTFMGVSDALNGTQTAVADRVYQSVEQGNVLTTGNAWINVVGAIGVLRRSGSSGAVFFRVYHGTSLMGTSFTTPQNNVGTSGSPVIGYFDRVISIPPNSRVRVVASTNAGDSSTNYNYFYGQVWDSNYPDNAPQNIGTTKLASGTWTDNAAGRLFQIALLLHPNEPYSSGPLNRRQFNSQR